MSKRYPRLKNGNEIQNPMKRSIQKRNGNSMNNGPYSNHNRAPNGNHNNDHNNNRSWNYNGNHNGNGPANPPQRNQPQQPSFKRASFGQKMSFDRTEWNKTMKGINQSEGSDPRNGSNGHSNALGESTVTNTTETKLSGTILDHIELDKDAVEGKGDAIYERKNCKSFLEELRKGNGGQIPVRFDYPYCLPFYAKLPRIVHGTVSNDLVFPKADSSAINSKKECV